MSLDLMNVLKDSPYRQIAIFTVSFAVGYGMGIYLAKRHDAYWKNRATGRAFPEPRVITLGHYLRQESDIEQRIKGGV